MSICVHISIWAEGEKGFHPPQMCSSAVLQDPNCMSLDADDVSICWMLIGWQVGWKREGSNSRVHQEQEIKTSKIKKNAWWKAQRVVTVDMFHCFYYSVSLHLFLCCNFAFLCGWLMEKQQHERPTDQLYHIFVYCLHLATELSAGRWAVPEPE